MSDTTLPRWMQGDWTGAAPLLYPHAPVIPAYRPAPKPRPCPPEPFFAPLPDDCFRTRIRRRPAARRVAAPRAWLLTLGIALGLAGTQGLAIPDRGPLPLASPQTRVLAAPASLPAAEMFASDDPADAPPPPVLTSEAVASIQAAMDVGAYRGPAPAGAIYAAASSVDRERALTCMTQAIYYEAGTESETGQRAVAQVVLNRVRHPDYPNSVCGVVYQGCQFSFTCDGALARPPMPSLWMRARRYAEDALSGRAFAGVGFSTHYHTIDIWPYWASVLPVTTTIGRHIFHVMPGRGGAPSAFTARYAGREPAPRPYRGPIRTASAPDPELAAIIAEAARAAEDRLPPAPVARAEAAPAPSPDNLPTSSAIDNRLPDSRIRPEHADSGQWIGG